MDETVVLDFQADVAEAVAAVGDLKRATKERGRMLRAVELRAQGKSLREIASALGCSRMTVARDLQKWAQERANVSHLSVPEMPPGGKKGTAEWDSSATVIPLRKASHG